MDLPASSARLRYKRLPDCDTACKALLRADLADRAEFEALACGRPARDQDALDVFCAHNDPSAVWIPFDGMGRPVGVVAVSRGVLSYCVAPGARRRGYGAEAVQAICQATLEQAPSAAIEAFVCRENIASRRLLEKLAFRFLGLENDPALRRVLLRFALVAEARDPKALADLRR